MAKLKPYLLKWLHEYADSCVNNHVLKAMIFNGNIPRIRFYLLASARHDIESLAADKKFDEARVARIKFALMLHHELEDL